MSMIRKPVALLAAAIVLTACLFCSASLAGHDTDAPAKQAIVVTAFGTSYPEALASILNIKSHIEKAFPGVPVRLAFSSNIIRKIWRERSTDAGWQKENPGVPAEVLHVKTPLATIADLQDEGFTDILVQSSHVFAGEEFHDLQALVGGLNSIRTLKAKFMPFNRLVLGRPALGVPGDAIPFTEDMETAAEVLAPDIEQARKMGAALVYMGHGNDYFSTGIYGHFQKVLQDKYHYPVFIGCVEGFPAFDDMLAALSASGKKTVLLKPFMVVAGDHANNDMAGDEDDAWKVLLTKAGFKVTPELRGLGSLDGWAEIYVRHLRDAAGK